MYYIATSMLGFTDLGVMSPECLKPTIITLLRLLSFAMFQNTTFVLQSQDTSSRTVSVDGASHCLTLNSLSINDQGTYEFRVGGQTSKARLSVRGKYSCDHQDV